MDLPSFGASYRAGSAIRALNVPFHEKRSYMKILVNSVNVFQHIARMTVLGRLDKSSQSLWLYERNIQGKIPHRRFSMKICFQTFR